MSTPYSLPVLMVISADLSKLSFFRRALKGEYHLVEKQDAATALESLKSSLIDVILLDSNLPDTLILDLCRDIRKLTPHIETPILLITRRLKKNYTQEALQAGVSDFVNEPLDLDEIHQRLEVSQRMKQRQGQIETLAKKIPSPKAEIPLADREILSDKAIHELAKARKNAALVSVLMIELDTKKNDDDALLHLTEALQKNLRKHDILIPQTPGRFILVLPKTSNRAAKAIAETIRREIAAIDLSVSIGLISFDPSSSNLDSAAEDFDNLIEGVTRAIEEAKRTGNKIVTMPPPEEKA